MGVKISELAAWAGQLLGTDYAEVARSGTSRRVPAGAFSSLRRVLNVSVDTTLDTSHDVVVVDSSVAQRTMTLPDPTTCAEKTFTVKRRGANNVVLSPASGTIDGGASLTISTDKGWAVVVSDGTEYQQIGG